MAFEEEDNALHCRVTDNGIGRKAAGQIAARQQRTDKSRGLENIRQRLDLLRKRHQQHFTLEIADLTNASGEAIGTSIELVFPLN